MNMQGKKTSGSQELNVVKFVWGIMLSVKSMPQKELTLKLKKHFEDNGISKSETACFHIIKLLGKPIQIGYSFEKGNVKTEFVQEPLLVEYPSFDQQVHHGLHSFWRDFVDSRSGYFEKSKKYI